MGDVGSDDVPVLRMGSAPLEGTGMTTRTKPLVVLLALCVDDARGPNAHHYDDGRKGQQRLALEDEARHACR